MKSVFHLCEALFYVAWDGTELHREGLTPWKQGDRMPHPEWDETTDADWEHLAEFGRGSSPGGDSSWFLLWIPLRSRNHLETPSGEESGSIIGRFPGDDPSGDLAFLNDTKLAHDVAEMLPLLRHLDRVEHRGEANPFVLQLTDGPRLMGITTRKQSHGATIHGQILKGNGQPLLCFSGRRHVSTDADGCFAKMKALDEWPRIRSRDELGRETLAADKTCQLQKNRPIHAFTAQNTGFSDRGSVQLMFTASEDKPHAVFLNLVQSRTESFAKRK